MSNPLKFKRDDEDGRNCGYYWVSGKYLIHRIAFQKFSVTFGQEVVGTVATLSDAKDIARTHFATQSVFTK